MTRIAVVRPEPGNTATADRARARGFAVLQLPVFAVVPLGWTPPPARDYDALLVTSANAIRHGGAGLEALKTLPVVAVGAASATAARDAGFAVAATGSGDAAAAATLAAAHDLSRLLHLSGRERIDIPGTDAIAVYASDPIALADDAAVRLAGRIVLIHSPRAAVRLGDIVVDRASIGIAALSAAVAAAAGPGWASIRIADVPTDGSLLDAVAAD